MSDERPDLLYERLPRVHRTRDAEQGQALRALLRIIEREAAVIERDVEELYDNWFIETCREWVVPYIGDLLGVASAHDVRPETFSMRAYVANTLAYRRRKGTASVLEQLTRDVSGWPAHAVEFFQLISTSVHLGHVLEHPTLADLRDSEALELLGGAFERSTHTADVRATREGTGRYGLSQVGLFAWPIESFPVRLADAPAAAATGRYRFHPLGLDAPLFNLRAPEQDIAGLAGERNVPAPLRRRPLHDELETLRHPSPTDAPPREWFADPPAFALEVDGTEVPAEEIVVCDLRTAQDAATDEWPQPAGEREYEDATATVKRPIRAAVDPVLGRIAFAPGKEPAGRLRVNYAYGFSGDLGGGPYDRRASLETARSETGGRWLAPDVLDWQAGVTADADTLATASGPGVLFPTVTAAVATWHAQLAREKRPLRGLIAIMDSASYAESLDAAGAIEVPPGASLALVAADWPGVKRPDPSVLRDRPLGALGPEGQRPHLAGNLSVRGTDRVKEQPPPAAGTPGGVLVIDGLLVEGELKVLSGRLGGLRVAHCTLVPAGGGIRVYEGQSPGNRNDDLKLDLERCLTGPLTLGQGRRKLAARASIIDGDVAGPATEATLDAATVLGGTEVLRLDASNTIFAEPASAARRQAGCVRFSYVPNGSTVPRPYRCQPDLALRTVPNNHRKRVLARVRPAFASTRFGDPRYGRLAGTCPEEIARGADDEGEMGALHFLHQPQRAANVRAALNEYMPFGLEAGTIYMEEGHDEG